MKPFHIHSTINFPKYDTPFVISDAADMTQLPTRVQICRRIIIKEHYGMLNVHKNLGTNLNKYK